MSPAEFGASRSFSAAGESRLDRELAAEGQIDLTPVDLDGDGRDELLVRSLGRLRALRADLTELWSTLTAEPPRDILRASAGWPATVILHDGLGLDGITGKPIWSIGQPHGVLAASDGKTLSRSLEVLESTTICRMPVPPTAPPIYAPAQGVPARATSPRDDPRWARRLPWVAPVEPATHPLVHLAFATTLVNVCIPWSILWLARAAGAS